MKGAIIGGVIVLVLSAIFTMGAVGQYMESSSKGESPNIDELKIPIIVGGIGVFAGIGLIFMGFKLRSSK